jgi:hypothetical protein
LHDAAPKLTRGLPSTGGAALQVVKAVAGGVPVLAEENFYILIIFIQYFNNNSSKKNLD